MKCETSNRVSRMKLPVLLAVAIAVGLVPCILLSAFAQEPFPTQIRDVKMGVPMAEVLAMVKDAGTHVTKPLPLPDRNALVWHLPDNPNFRQVVFQFTEKDRLFLIRFDMKNVPFRDLRALKKDLFEKYGISWDSPWTMKIKENDAVLYGPPSIGNIYFFEITNPKTGEKALEIMDRAISGEDRRGRPIPEAEKEQGQPLSTESPGKAGPSKAAETESKADGQPVTPERGESKKENSNQPALPK
ncbi:MAG: hypothetical protein AB1733_08115 [Thermodesulfobacteriota bacterium]